MWIEFLQLRKKIACWEWTWQGSNLRDTFKPFKPLYHTALPWFSHSWYLCFEVSSYSFWHICGGIQKHCSNISHFFLALCSNNLHFYNFEYIKGLVFSHCLLEFDWSMLLQIKTCKMLYRKMITQPGMCLKAMDTPSTSFQTDRHCKSTAVKQSAHGRGGSKHIYTIPGSVTLSFLRLKVSPLPWSAQTPCRFCSTPKKKVPWKKLRKKFSPQLEYFILFTKYVPH